MWTMQMLFTCSKLEMREDSEQNGELFSIPLGNGRQEPVAEAGGDKQKKQAMNIGTE